MKKAIISVISVLCVGLIVVGPVKETYANNSNKEEQKATEVVATKTDTNTTDKKVAEEPKEQVTASTDKQNTTKKENVTEQKQQPVQQPVQQQTTQNVVKEEPKTEEQPVVEQKSTLTQAQALQLVKAYEPGVAGYDYMGDENTYPCIKAQGIKGYVFLPQCDGDMAYLVDKNTGNIYFFHPSGYFELLK